MHIYLLLVCCIIGFIAGILGLIVFGFQWTWIFMTLVNIPGIILNVIMIRERNNE